MRQLICRLWEAELTVNKLVVVTGERKHEIAYKRWRSWTTAVELCDWAAQVRLKELEI